MPDDFSTNNTTAGFRIGRHNDDANYKFLIKYYLLRNLIILINFTTHNNTKTYHCSQH